MGDISMDDGAVTVEGAEACQGELTIEDGSLGNGIIDADGAQARGVQWILHQRITNHKTGDQCQNLNGGTGTQKCNDTRNDQWKTP